MPCTKNQSLLRMCFWNVGGLVSKHNNKFFDPLFIKELNNYDIIFLAETHIDPDFCLDNMNQYYFYKVCRKQSRHNNRYFGGLGILVRKELKTHIKILNNTNPDFQWIKLDGPHFGFQKDLFICLIYFSPPGSTYTIGLNQDILEIVEKDIVKYQTFGNVMLCGDFNARTASECDFISDDDNNFIPFHQSYPVDRNITQRKSQDQITDSRGRELLDICISQQLRFLNGRVLGDLMGKFTCHTTNGSSTVDYVVVSDEILDQILYFQISPFIPTLSDTHCKLEWAISANYKATKNTSKTKLRQVPPRFIWDEKSEHKFLTALSTEDISSKLTNFVNTQFSDNSQENINRAAEHFSEIIISAASSCLVKKSMKKSRPRSQKWFNKDLKQMRFDLINYGKVFSKYPRDTWVRNHYFKKFREYTKARKKANKEYKQSILNQLATLHEDKPKAYWNLLNELKQNTDSIKSRHSNTIDPQTWISHFNKLNSVQPEFHSRIEELKTLLHDLEKPRCFNEMDMPISQSEISKAISKLKSNKSPGMDNISNQMLKHGQHAFLPSLKKLFNMCLSSGTYPNTWATGVITTIHKSGDINEPNNYRGITVSSAVGKVFNSILNNRLDMFLEKHNIINDCQIGFTKKARTSDHMFILKCITDKYCNSKEGRVYACFVDFQKAFDTVIHTGIKIKLLKMGAGNLFYNIIKNMYEVSTSCIRINDRVSENFHPHLGVKQGDNLSPNLFKIFINDLPDYLDNSSDSIILNERILNCLMYADDLILLSTSAQGLQAKLDILDKYCKDWCLNINTSKTKVMIFNKAGRTLSHKFVLRNVSIECVSRYKYLGIYFSASGSFTYAQTELYKKALKAYYKLSKELLSENPEVKISLHVFDHTIVPILLYGSEIWGSFNTFTARFRNERLSLDQVFSKLCCEKLHVKFCKLILGVHKKAPNFGVMSELGRFPLHFNLTKTMLQYWFRLENLESSFPILKDAYIVSKQLFAQKIPSWYGAIQYILDTFPSMKALALSSKNQNQFKYKIKKCLRSIYLDSWRSTLLSNLDGKLRTYTKFKSNFQRECYLSILTNVTQRKNFTRFRISCHQLKIETGRYTGIPCNLRICPHCNNEEIQDEIHFLFKCPTYHEERSYLYGIVENVCPSFKYLTDVEKLIWVMNAEDKTVLVAVSKFIINNLKQCS